MKQYTFKELDEFESDCPLTNQLIEQELYRRLGLDYVITVREPKWTATTSIAVDWMIEHNPVPVLKRLPMQDILCYVREGSPPYTVASYFILGTPIDFELDLEHLRGIQVTSRPLQLLINAALAYHDGER